MPPRMLPRTRTVVTIYGPLFSITHSALSPIAAMLLNFRTRPWSSRKSGEPRGAVRRVSERLERVQASVVRSSTFANGYLSSASPSEKRNGRTVICSFWTA